jgi:hypothetical protein
MTVPRVVTGVGKLPRQGLQPAGSSGSEPGGPGFSCFPRHQDPGFKTQDLSTRKPASRRVFALFYAL